MLLPSFQNGPASAKRDITRGQKKRYHLSPFHDLDDRCIHCSLRRLSYHKRHIPSWADALLARKPARSSSNSRGIANLTIPIEQDHRFIKRLTKPGMGFFSFETAWRTLQGYEIMNMRRKGQVQGVAKGDVKGQIALVATLFGVAV